MSTLVISVSQLQSIEWRAEGYNAAAMERARFRLAGFEIGPKFKRTLGLRFV